MPDLSAQIARMIVEGEGIPPGSAPLHMVSLIIDRWPEATADEIERGFNIAFEIAMLDRLSEDVRHA